MTMKEQNNLDAKLAATQLLNKAAVEASAKAFKAMISDGTLTFRISSRGEGKDLHSNKGPKRKVKAGNKDNMKLQWAMVSNHPYYPSVQLFETEEQAWAAGQAEYKDMHAEDGRCEGYILIAKISSKLDMTTHY